MVPCLEVFFSEAKHFIAEKTEKTKATNAGCTDHSFLIQLISNSILFNEFNALFPGQIEQAEMLLETSKLEELVDERKKLIKRHENIDSLYRYKCWKKKDKKPDEPKVRDMHYLFIQRTLIAVSQNVSPRFFLLSSDSNW